LKVDVARYCVRIILAFVIVLILSIPLVTSADTWQNYFSFSVTNNSSSDMTGIPVLTGINGQALIDLLYLNASGNNSVMKEISTDRDYGSSTSNISILIPALAAYQTKVFKFYTGYVPAGTMGIIPGNNGYVTTADSAALEWGSSANITVSGYFDPASTGNIILKTDAYKIVGSGAGNVVATSYNGSMTNSAAFRPNAAGSLTQLTPSAGSNYACSGDNNDATYVYRIGTTYYGDLYNITNHTTEGDSINSVTVYFRLTGSVVYNSYGIPQWKINSVSYNGTEQSQGNGTSNKSQTYNTSPATGMAWTWAELDSAQYGIWLKSSSADGDKPGRCADVWYIVNYNVPITLTAYGISADEHTFKLGLAGGTLSFQVDAASANTTAMSGNVTNNGNAIIFGTGNIMPYADYISMYVGASEVLRYEPVTMISGTTLLDIATGDGTQNGVITWGTNSASLIISQLGITGYESTVPPSSSAGSSDVVGDYSQSSNWFVTGTFGGILTPEMQETFENAANGIGMEPRSLYFMIMIGTSVAIGFSVLLFTGSVMISLVTTSIILVAASGTQVIDYALVFVAIVLMLGIYYLVKQH